MWIPRFRILGSLVPVAVVVCAVHADQLHVPSEYPTIQAAIDAADPNNGDQVVIADGTYTGVGNKNLNFGGKAITVHGASRDPALCIIDCENDGRGFLFNRGEGPDSIAEGLTIRNAYVSYDSHGNGYGGAIYCSNSDPTFLNCAITGNMADLGGALYCIQSAPMLAVCTITENLAGNGGAIYCEFSSNPTLTNCTISGNSAHDGGAICCHEASCLTLTNCAINGNTASGTGGAICCENACAPTLTNCAINGNSARGSGGGIHCYSTGGLALTKCAINGNSTRGNGGGIYCYYDTPATLTNCTCSGNHARSGGGIYCGDNATITNCTITGNAADQDGGGIHCSGNPTLANCILWDNLPQEILTYSGSAVVTYCDIKGGWSGAGNIDTDPLFAFPGDPYLTPNSPCIDAGTNAPAGGLPPGDLDGNARPLDGNGDAIAIADMGAYEFNPAVPSIALSPARFEFSAPEGGDDPASQLLALRNCGGGKLNWEISGRPAWMTVAPGGGDSSGEVDEVTIGVDISGLPYGAYTAVLAIADPQAVNSPRHVVITLYVSGHTFHVPGESSTIQEAIDTALPGDVVEIADGTYTGTGNKNLDFGGKAITLRSALGDRALCVIDCQRDDRGIDFRNGEGPDSIVEGLTITNGREFYDIGGGVYCHNHSSPTLINCVISDSAARFGGGVTCNADSNPTFLNCAISENSAAGIYCKSASNPTFTNCVISGNSDAGVHCQAGSNPTFTNCAISDNPAHGVYCDSNSNLTFNCCTITGNASDGNGGGVCCHQGSPTFTNCEISRNSAAGSGGGVYCSASSLTMIGCVVMDNTGADGAGVSCNSGGNSTLSNCTISRNSSSYFHHGGGGVYCADSNPTLTDCTITENSAVRGGGGVLCWNSNATLINCTIAGNTAEADGAGLCCYNSSPMLNNCTISGNSAATFYYQDGGGVYCSDSNPTLTNCAINGNSATHGGGVYCAADSYATLTNCTISDNSANHVYGLGGGIYCANVGPALANCILWDNTPQEIYSYSGAPVVLYCDVKGGWPGTGNIDADPLFTDPDGSDEDPNTWEDNDYRLTTDSPCVDAGDPNFVADLGETDLAGRVRVWDGDSDDTRVVDIGAYEFGSHGYGDLNCDGWVNNGDVDAFVFALSYPEQYADEYPDCDITLADINADGWTNNGDIDAFIALLIGR